MAGRKRLQSQQKKEKKTSDEIETKRMQSKKNRQLPTPPFSPFRLRQPVPAQRQTGQQKDRLTHLTSPEEKKLRPRRKRQVCEEQKLDGSSSDELGLALLRLLLLLLLRGGTLPYLPLVLLVRPRMHRQRRASLWMGFE